MSRSAQLRLSAVGIMAASLLAAIVAPASAADAAAGRRKAQVCQPCHGIDGLSQQPDAPNIAGQIADYLSRQLQSFRAGERTNEQMSIIAQSLSDDDIADLAAWYSSIQVTATMPQ